MASSKIILYESKVLKDGSHPVMLRVTHDRKPKYYSLGFTCMLDEWDNVHHSFSSKYKNYKKVNTFLKQKEVDIENIFIEIEQEGKGFSFDRFEKLFFKTNYAPTVFNYFDIQINNLLEANQIGNSFVYKDTKSHLFQFNQNKDIAFNDVDYKFLVNFVQHCKSKGMKNSSISVYMRTFRALFNKAKKEYEFEHYPFKDFDFTELKSPTRKIAITKDEIQKIKEYAAKPGTGVFNAKHYFMFMYYNRGMNFTDVAMLKKTDISNGSFEYIRAKTHKAYKIKILEPVQDIFNYYKNNSLNTEFVFPIIFENHITPLQRKKRIAKALKTFNKELRKIAEAVGISTNLTSYVSRHSWATILKREGVSTSIISEGMGHDTERTTQIYLDSFEDDVLFEASKKALL